MSDTMELQPPVQDIPNYSVTEEMVKYNWGDVKAFTVTFGEPKRTVRFREPLLTDHFDLLEMAPNSVADSESWIGMATIALVTTDIDGSVVPTATRKLHLRNTLGRLGRDGLAAVARAMQPGNAAASEATAEMSADAAKN